MKMLHALTAVMALIFVSRAALACTISSDCTQDDINQYVNETFSSGSTVTSGGAVVTGPSVQVGVPTIIQPNVYIEPPIAVIDPWTYLGGYYLLNPFWWGGHFWDWDGDHWRGEGYDYDHRVWADHQYGPNGWRDPNPRGHNIVPEHEWRGHDWRKAAEERFPGFHPGMHNEGTRNLVPRHEERRAEPLHNSLRRQQGQPSLNFGPHSEGFKYEHPQRHEVQQRHVEHHYTMHEQVHTHSEVTHTYRYPVGNSHGAMERGSRGMNHLDRPARVEPRMHQEQHFSGHEAHGGGRTEERGQQERR